MKLLKQIGVFTLFALVFTGCGKKQTTELTENNPIYSLWSADSTLYDALTLDMKYAVASFNEADTLCPQDVFSLPGSDCMSQKITFSSSDGKYFLYINDFSCQSLGSTFDITYWNKNRKPMFRFLQYVSPSNSKTMQNLIFYENDVISKSVSRSGITLAGSELSGFSFSDYSPTPVEQEIPEFPCSQE